MVSTVTYNRFDPHLTLSFSHDSMRNTSITGKDGGAAELIHYEVVTKDVQPSGSHTVITRFSDGYTSGKREVASIKKKDILPDTISFGEGKAVRLGKWLGDGKERFVAGTVATDFGKLLWRHGDPDCPFRGSSLVADDDRATVLAHFTRSETTSLPELQISNNAAHMVDIIVVSLLVVIQKGRVDVGNLRSAAAMGVMESRLLSGAGIGAN